MEEHAEDTAAESGSPSRPWQLLLLSAKTGTALETSAARLAAFLQEHPETDFADVLYTLKAGQRSFRHRLALLCRDGEDALTVLAGADPQRLLRSEQESDDRPVTFLFSGLGEHYPGMARDLYATEPTFRAVLDECCDLLAPHLGLDLRRLLFPPLSPGASAARRPDLRAMLGRGEQRQQSELDRTLYAQPAVFVVEYALTRLLMEWGIRPQSMIGYSLGEYVAACVAGVLSLPEAIALVARRARLIDSLPAGAMLAVPLAEEDARRLLGNHLSIAALNGPCVSVLSGPEDAIGEVERRLAERSTPARRLPTTHAFHSRMMEPIRDTFARMVREVTLHPPEIPYLSNVTGTWITAAEATDPAYWVRHLCQAVRFADGLAELSREPERVLLEVGPGQGLTALALQAPGELVAISTLRSSWDPQPDTAFLLTALAKLWLAGLRVDWTGFYAHERRRRVPLPAEPSRPWQALVLSAPTEAALEKETAGLAETLRRHPETDLGDVAYTLQTGRRVFDHRRTLVCRDVDDALSVLASGAGRLETFAGSEGERQVSFLLPGVGDHYPDMALDLYRGEPAFRRIVDGCCDGLLPELGFDLRDELFPGLAGGGAAEPAAASSKRDLRRILQSGGRSAGSGRLTRMTAVHPAVFVVEYALAQLLMGWGIHPRAMIGYSLGEYTAACLAGVISLADGLTLVARRARLIEGLPAGAMLAVPLTGEEIEPLLRDGLGVAVVNGPALHVVSGPLAAVEALEAELAARGVLCRRLSADQAGHSPMMEPIAGRLRELLAGFELKPPKIPYISNVTGTWIRPEEATDPDYWVRHLCGRVLFGNGLGRLLEVDSVLLEVGPGQSLTAFAKQHPARDSGTASLMFSTLRSAFNAQPDRAFLLATLGRLWMAGVPIDWASTHAGRRRMLVFGDPTERSEKPGGRRRVHVWPNGMRIVYQTQTEAEHFYKDIFEKRIYLRHGIELREGACIFDVGANIGSFMLFAHQACRKAQIYSFEPAPPLFEKLRLNAALNQVDARLFNFGLSDHAGMARFTFYPYSSGMSSFHADKEQEKEILRLMMERERETGLEGVGELMSCANDLLEERFRSESFECRLRPLSDVIEECEVEWIDLLKIDVQKAELAVLQGIREEHWSKIGQIVLEVHDLDGRLERSLRLLEERGFRVTVEQDELVRGSVLYNLFAIGAGAGPQEDARERQRRAYQRQIEPASPMRPVFGVQYTAPGSELERSIAEIWQRVLHVENLGIDDNFFDLGGTSLTGLQAIRQLNGRLGVELSPVAIFEAPTVRTLARSLQPPSPSSAPARVSAF